MREALGQPLQNISKELLNKVVSKEVARDLRKYKYTVAGGNTGKTPSKENRRLNGQLSAEKGGSLRLPNASILGLLHQMIEPTPQMLLMLKTC